MANVFLRREENPVETPQYIGVIGSGTCAAGTYSVARDLGFEIGKRGWVLVCGGLKGVMEGAARDAQRLEA